VALTSGLPALVRGEPFMTAQAVRVPLPVLGSVKLSTVLQFDVGVYLVVLGTVLLIIFTLGEE
jgi:multicomponent Na+:H+ antiporter subunit B